LEAVVDSEMEVVLAVAMWAGMVVAAVMWAG